MPSAFPAGRNEIKEDVRVLRMKKRHVRGIFFSFFSNESHGQPFEVQSILCLGLYIVRTFPAGTYCYETKALQ
jgi:hypothetical protein